MKTLNELIKELQSILAKDSKLGEVPVYVIADHGQTLIRGGNVSVDFTEEYEYYAETVDIEELSIEQKAERKPKQLLPIITIGD